MVEKLWTIKQQSILFYFQETMPPKRDMRNRGKGKGKRKEKVVEVEPFNPCEELKPMALVAGFRQTTEKLDEETKEILQFQISKCKEKLEL